MDNRMISTVQSRQKKMIIGFLYLGTLIIMFLGIFFSTYSVLNKISIRVLGAAVPGIVFGLLVAYLGLRYFFQISDFKNGFYKSTAKFSWGNFRKRKNRKFK